MWMTLKRGLHKRRTLCSILIQCITVLPLTKPLVAICFLQDSEGKGQDPTVAMCMYRKVSFCHQLLPWFSRMGSTCGAGQRPCRCSTDPWWWHRNWRLCQLNLGRERMIALPDTPLITSAWKCFSLCILNIFKGNLDGNCLQTGNLFTFLGVAHKQKGVSSVVLGHSPTPTHLHGAL